ncbi:hypothetical protein RJI07_06095 [Mycoplasmatota bacterium WC30]
MEYIYYIANRFFPANNRGYADFGKNNDIIEIVTLDSIICKIRYFDIFSDAYISTDLYIGKLFGYEEIKKFDLKENEQIIRYCKMSEKSNVSITVADFEFCGYDILDYYEDNSYITNYGIEYNFQYDLYTIYGLLKTLDNVKKWLKLNEHQDSGLQNKEYVICAVWRQIK